MKYRLSPIANELNGPIGGLTFVDHAKSPYVRANPSVIPAPTPDQTAVRNAYGAIVELWRSFSPELKNTWSVAGEADKISGFNLFVKNNINRELAGNPIYVTPDNSLLVPPYLMTCQKGFEHEDLEMGFLKTPGLEDYAVAGYRDYGSNRFSVYNTQPINGTYWTFHEDLFSAQCNEYYTMDSDAPSAEKGTFNNMTAHLPGSISQYTTGDGMKVQRYGNAQCWNSISGLPTDLYAMSYDWAFSCFLRISRNASAPNNYTIIDLNDQYLIRWSWTSVQFFMDAKYSSGVESHGWDGPDPYDWVHLVFAHHSSTNRFYGWLNGSLVLYASESGSGDHVGSGVIRLGNFHASADHHIIDIAQPSIWGSGCRPVNVWWEHSLRNPDFRSAIIDGSDVDSRATGYIFTRDLAFTNVGPDSFNKSSFVP